MFGKINEKSIQFYWKMFENNIFYVNLSKLQVSFILALFTTLKGWVGVVLQSKYGFGCIITGEHQICSTIGFLGRWTRKWGSFGWEIGASPLNLQKLPPKICFFTYSHFERSDLHHKGFWVADQEFRLLFHK